jgi:hypothetical protein
MLARHGNNTGKRLELLRQHDREKGEVEVVMGREG